MNAKRILFVIAAATCLIGPAALASASVFPPDKNAAPDAPRTRRAPERGAQDDNRPKGDDERISDEQRARKRDADRRSKVREDNARRDNAGDDDSRKERRANRQDRRNPAQGMAPRDGNRRQMTPPGPPSMDRSQRRIRPSDEAPRADEPGDMPPRGGKWRPDGAPGPDGQRPGDGAGRRMGPRQRGDSPRGERRQRQSFERGDRFNQIDRNGDGVIDRAEFRAAAPGAPGAPRELRGERRSGRERRGDILNAPSRRPRGDDDRMNGPRGGGPDGPAAVPAPRGPWFGPRGRDERRHPPASPQWRPGQQNQGPRHNPPVPPDGEQFERRPHNSEGRRRSPGD